MASRSPGTMASAAMVAATNAAEADRQRQPPITASHERGRGRTKGDRQERQQAHGVLVSSGPVDSGS